MSYSRSTYKCYYLLSLFFSPVLSGKPYCYIHLLLLYPFIINGSTGDSIDCNARTPLYIYASHVKLFSYHTNMRRNIVSHIQGDHCVCPKVGEPEHGPANRCVLVCCDHIADVFISLPLYLERKRVNRKIHTLEYTFPKQNLT